MHSKINAEISILPHIIKTNAEKNTEICSVDVENQVGRNSIYAGRAMRDQFTSPASAMDLNRSGRDTSFVTNLMISCVYNM